MKAIFGIAAVVSIAGVLGCAKNESKGIEPPQAAATDTVISQKAAPASPQLAPVPPLPTSTPQKARVAVGPSPKEVAPTQQLTTQNNTLTFEPTEFTTNATASIRAAQTETECVRIQNSMRLLYNSIVARERRLQEIGDMSNEGLNLNYAAGAVRALGDAADCRRLALIQLHPEIAPPYEKECSLHLAAARQFANLCTRPVTVYLGQ